MIKFIDKAKKGVYIGNILYHLYIILFIMEYQWCLAVKRPLFMLRPLLSVFWPDFDRGQPNLANSIGLNYRKYTPLTVNAVKVSFAIPIIYQKFTQ